MELFNGRKCPHALACGQFVQLLSSSFYPFFFVCYPEHFFIFFFFPFLDVTFFFSWDVGVIVVVVVVF